MTTVTEFQADVGLRLHDVGNVELTAAQVILLLNQAARWARSSGVLIDIEEDESLTEAANTYSFTVPSGFAYIRQIIRENVATGTFDPQNAIDQNSWRLGTNGGSPTIFFDEVRYLPSGGANLKILGQARPKTNYTTGTDTIDDGMEALLLERVAFYAFQFLAAGRSEYATWRQQEALIARAESESLLARGPQQFRMKPGSRRVPGR